MRAYNYIITFDSLFKDQTGIAGMYDNTINVGECTTDKKEKFLYKSTFNNSQGRDVALYTNENLSSTKIDKHWAFEVEGVVTFYWKSGSLTLEYTKGKQFTKKLLMYWCLHIALPLFFTVEERYEFLHAGAVEVEGKPVLFVAESFGGKSTMTDYFMRQGHTMISDDKVGSYEEDGVFYAVPSHPHHRPHRGMEDLGIFVENIAKKPKPIHTIYELVKSDAKAKIAITQLHGIEKFKSLRYSSEINLSHLKAKRFSFLMKMAKVVKVYQVSVPWDLERLDEVYRAIVTEL